MSAVALCQDGPQVNIVPRFRPAPDRQNTSFHEPSLHLDVKMVMIPANVTGPDDRPVLDLHKEDFHVFEGAVEQKIASFSIDQAPVSLGIVFDSSGSMRNKLDKSVVAVRQFLKTSLPGDEFFLVQFSDTPALRVPFTPNADDITDSLGFVQPQGWTAMYDAICLAVNQMRFAKNSRKALLILSDGGDNNSRYNSAEVIDILREADVRLYAIGLFDSARFLKKAAEDTGGAAVEVQNLKDLPNAVDTLSTQLRSQYLLGYYPAEPQNDGKFHAVKVLLSNAASRLKLRTSWRHGYYAPY
ncbi:MAG TPA: VWA domain-containing protein [Bryobacteraceae bacterium]